MSTKQRNDLDFGGAARALNLPDAASAQEPMTLAQGQALLQNLAWKDDVRVAAPGNINLASPGASIDGVTLANGDSFLVGNQTAATENGIYVFNGAAAAATRRNDADTFAKLASAIVAVNEGTSAGTQWRQTQVNGVIGTNALQWTSFQASAPSASETTAGIAEIATQAEMDAGVDDVRIATPKKIAASPFAARKTSTAFGDGSATQYDITHNLNTLDVLVRVRRTASPYDSIGCDVQSLDANTVRLIFAAGLAPAANEFTAVIWG
jgi:hypothetical protein